MERPRRSSSLVGVPACDCRAIAVESADAMSTVHSPRSTDGGRHFSVRSGWVQEGPLRYVSAAFMPALLFIMVVPNGFAFAGRAPLFPTHPLLQLFVMGAGSWILLTRYRLALLQLRFINPLFLALLATMVASVLWAMFPTNTIGRLIRVFTIILGAYGFCLMGWHAQRFSTSLRQVLTGFMVLSIGFGIVSPQLAIHQSDAPELVGAWHGLANHKNQFGSLAAFAVLLWVHAWAARQTPRAYAVLGVLISVAALLLSRSSTSLLVSVFASAFVVIMLRMPSGWRRLRPIIVITFSLVVVLYSLVVVDKLPGAQILLKPVAMITGKSMDFTGRAPIWDVMYEEIGKHLMLGIGYGSYWVGDAAWSPARYMVEKVYFYPGSAHNGYLDILNDLGIVGLSVLIGMLLVYVMQAVALFRAEPAQGSLYLAVLFQQALGNLSESYIMYFTSPQIVWFVLAVLCMARAQLDLQLRHYFGTPALEQGGTAAGFRPPPAWLPPSHLPPRAIRWKRDDSDSAS